MKSATAVKPATAVKSAAAASMAASNGVPCGTDSQRCGDRQNFALEDRYLCAHVDCLLITG
jgi:hypothetical protein